MIYVHMLCQYMSNCSQTLTRTCIKHVCLHRPKSKSLIIYGPGMSEFVIEDSNFDNAKTLRKLIAYMNSLTLAY